MRLTPFSPALLLATTTLVGCVAPQTPLTSPEGKGGAIGFFDQVNGKGTISIRLIDNRRSTQAIADAAPYNAVRFELQNASKLGAPRVKGLAAAGGAYNAVFTSLPSDDQARYTLNVGLFSGVASPGDLNSAGYANADQKVGEGVSLPFSLQPGQNATITVVINAVGAITFSSTTSSIDPTNPQFTPGDPSAKGLIRLSSLANPLATSLKYYVVNSSAATVSVGFLAPAFWSSPGSDTSLSFVAPATPGTYTFVADMMRGGGHLLSRRTRTFSVVSPLPPPPGNTLYTVISDLTQPVGVTADPSGAVYWVEDYGTVLQKWTPGGAINPAFGTGMTGTTDVVRTSNGDFIVCGNAAGLWRIPAMGGPAAPLTDSLGNVINLNYPVALAIDASDNLYVADTGAGSVVRISASGVVDLAYYQGGPTFSTNGVAVDEQGNVYASSKDEKRVVKIFPGKTHTEWLTGFSEPAGMTVDRLGTLYVSDYGSGTVYQANTVGATGTKSVFGSAKGYIVRYDPTSNGIYVADYDAGQIRVLQ